MRLATVTRIARTIATLTGAEAQEAAADIRNRLAAALVRHKSLDTYQLVNETPARIDEAGDADIEIAFRKAISPWYASELFFELKHGHFRGYARTLHLRDGRGFLSKDAVVAHNGDMDEEILFYSVEGMGRAAADNALEQRLALLRDLGFVAPPEVAKRFVKVGHAAAREFVL